MIAIVESNFVLEIAFRHAEALDALHMLELSEAGMIRLVVPAYGCVEPLHKLGRNRASRRSLSQALQVELGEIARSTDFADVRDSSRATIAALANKSEVDEKEYRTVLSRLIRSAEVIPLTAEVIKAASARQLLDLKAQDALIFASVESFLTGQSGELCLFANKNARDFLTESVAEDLGKLSCDVVVTFAAARARIDAVLKARAESDI